MTVTKIIIIVLVIGVVGFAGLFVSMCYTWGDAPATHTYSREFETLDEKVVFLKKYFSFKSHDPTYLELDFFVSHYGKSGWFVGLGPNDWDIQVIAKIPPDEIPNWRKEYTPVDAKEIPMGLDWVKTLPGTVDRTGPFQWYHDKEYGRYYVGVDEKRSIIICRYWAM